MANSKAHVSRVASRWLRATTTKQEWLRILTQSRRAVEAAYSKDDPTGCLAAYKVAADSLRPLGDLLAGIRIQRPEEQRKLKNTLENIRVIKRLTSESFLADQYLDLGEIQASGIWYIWERLDAAIMAVLRVWDRIEQYQSIVRHFKHGPFMILNHFGYRPEEITAPLALLDSASDAIRKKGLGSILYGDIQLVTSKSGTYCGMYSERGDAVALNVNCTFRFSAVQTLVHEFGHRYWYKMLTQAQRDAYEDAYSGSAAFVLTLKDREDMWQAFEKADYGLKGAQRYLHNPDLPLAQYVNDLRKGVSLRVDPRMGMTAETVKRIFLRAKTRLFMFEDARPKSVTDYGRTEVNEDYAEVFAFYCLDRPLTQDARDRFLLTVG